MARSISSDENRANVSTRSLGRNCMLLFVVQKDRRQEGPVGLAQRALSLISDTLSCMKREKCLVSSQVCRTDVPST